MSGSERHFPKLAAKEDIMRDRAAKPLTMGDDHHRGRSSPGPYIGVATSWAV